MFAITRKIVYKWHGMGDGVRNGVEDEVLSVGWLERLCVCERERERVREGGGEGREGEARREREKGKERRKEASVNPEGRMENERICPYDGARFAARKDFESKIDYHEVI